MAESLAIHLVICVDYELDMIETSIRKLRLNYKGYYNQTWCRVLYSWYLVKDVQGHIITSEIVIDLQMFIALYYSSIILS